MSFTSFGPSVALSSDGSTALIGAPNAIDYAGAAYVFVRSGSSWPLQAELTASDGAGGYPGDRFGAAVALNSNSTASLTTALIGAPGRNNSSGAVYVFVPFSAGLRRLS